MNIYWLGLDENCQPPATSGKCIEYPTHFRIDDVLFSAAAMGANVVRAHTLGISTGNPKSFQQNAGSENQFNDDALEVIDYALYRGAQLGLRFIVPLTDNYAWYHGGYHDFVDYAISAANLGESVDNCNWRPSRVVSGDDSCMAFWTSNSSTGLGTVPIDGFKTYVSTLLNHRNRYTGVLFKDDPAILAWESGNELQILGEPFVTWTADLARFIKVDVGAQQLVLDGRDQVHRGIDDAALAAEHVDMFTDHYYERFVRLR